MFYYVKPFLYPVLLNFLMFVACLAPYLQIVKEGNMQSKDFPFISDLGRYGVSAAIFSLFFSFYAFVIFIIMSWRFEQVKAKYTYSEHRCLHMANIVIYIIGLIACVGVCLLANFREIFEPIALLHTHMAGTWLAFGCGMVYFILQSIFSFFWKDLPGSKWYINLIRAVWTTVNFALCIAFIVELTRLMNTQDMTTVLIRKRSAILEWTFAFTLTANTLTFIPEFYKLEIKIVVNRQEPDWRGVGNVETNENSENFPRLVLHDSNNRLRVSDEHNSRLIYVDETQELLYEGCTSDDNMLL